MTYFDADAPARATSKDWRMPNLVWRRLPWWGELLVIGVGYFLYGRSRLAAPTKEQAAFFHSSQVWDLERLLHIDMELTLNHLVSAWSGLAEAVGYYYGTLHFILTPAVLIWLWVKRPNAYARLRSALVVATLAALVVFWVWPLAPPRLALPGATDVLVRYDIFGAAHPHGLSSMVNLYAAMPSLHVGWAAWCAFAVYTTTVSKWSRFVWLYPVITTFVVLGSANHYLLDAAGGVSVVALGLYLTRTGASDTTALERADAGNPGAHGSMIDLRRAPATRPSTDT